MPFTIVDKQRTAAGHELVLYRQGADFYIYIDGQELMSSRTHGSERALAELGCRHLAGTRAGAAAPRVLIGGLGLGYTLKAALEILPARAVVVVAELFQAVVGWHGELLDSLAVPLDDPRVRIHQEDVSELIAQAAADRPFDAILLDVDNGPSALCVSGNASLYEERGIISLRRALAPGGMLAVWSTDPDRAFVRRLSRAGLEASAEAVRAHGGKGARHTIFLARRVSRTPRSPPPRRGRR